MQIDDAKKAAIAEWLSQGESLSQIQTKLKTEFDISMTFMEVRFLIDDLNLELKKEEPAEPEANETESSNEVIEDANATLGGVAVEVDTIVTPGALVSGSVSFSDGINAKWQLDQMGRLGLSDVEQGYQPSPEDIQEFQTLLQEELKKKGFG